MIHGSQDPRITYIRDPCDPTDQKDPPSDITFPSRSRIRERNHYRGVDRSRIRGWIHCWKPSDPDPDQYLKGQQEPEPEPCPDPKISFGAGARAESSFRICNVKDLIFSETEYNIIGNIAGYCIKTQLISQCPVINTKIPVDTRLPSEF